MYGHVKTLAEAEVKGIQAAGGTVDLFQYESPARSLIPLSPYTQETCKC